MQLPSFFNRFLTLGKAPSPDSLFKKAKKAGSTLRIRDQVKTGFPIRAQADMEQWKLAEVRATDPVNPRRDWLMAVYRQIAKDGYLTGQIGTLKNKVLSEAFLLTDDAGKEQADVLKLLKRPWFFEFLGRVLDTDFYGHSLIEFDQLNADGEFERFDLIPREQVIPELGQVLLYPTDARGLPYRVKGDYTRLLLEVCLMDEEGKYSLGLLNKACPEVIMKRYARTDWSRACEKFGMPMIGLQTGATENDVLDDKEKALQNMGANGYMIYDEEEVLTVIEAKATNGGAIYKEKASFCNSEIAFMLTGQTMTSQDGASKSQGEVHERVQAHYIQTRMRFLDFYVNYTLIPFLKSWGYPLNGLTFKWRRWVDEENGRQNPPQPDTDPETETPPPPNAKGGQGKQGKTTAPAKQQLAAPFSVPAAGVGAAGALTLAGPDPTGAPKLRTLFDVVVKKLHTDRPKLLEMLETEQWQAMMAETGAQLTAAAEQGYGYQLTELVGGTPDAELLQKFADNLYVFSANKSYQLLTKLNDLLIDGSGQVRPYSDFKREALVLHQEYNVDWLKTEYDTAVGTAQMAAKWQGFQVDPEHYFLKYSTVNDDRVRPQHQAMDGITLPVDHDFWNLHYPPLGWKCRCTVVRVPRVGRKPSTDQEVAGIESPPPGFGHNAAKTGVVFPESHFYTDIPADAKPLLRQLAKEAAPKPAPRDE